jgi:hypothetical protein
MKNTNEDIYLGKVAKRRYEKSSERDYIDIKKVLSLATQPVDNHCYCGKAAQFPDPKELEAARERMKN